MCDGLTSVDGSTLTLIRLLRRGIGLRAESGPAFSHVGDSQLASVWALFAASGTLQFPFDTVSPRGRSALNPPPACGAALQSATGGAIRLFFAARSAMVTLSDVSCLIGTGAPKRRRCALTRARHCAEWEISAPDAVETSVFHTCEREGRRQEETEELEKWPSHLWLGDRQQHFVSRPRLVVRLRSKQLCCCSSSSSQQITASPLREMFKPPRLQHFLLSPPTAANSTIRLERGDRLWNEIICQWPCGSTAAGTAFPSNILISYFLAGQPKASQQL